MSHWRNIARPIIAECIKDAKGDDKALRKLLRDRYPFGEKEHHPYKMWRDEVCEQTNGRMGSKINTGKRSKKRTDAEKARCPALFPELED